MFNHTTQSWLQRHLENRSKDGGIKNAFIKKSDKTLRNTLTEN